MTVDGRHRPVRRAQRDPRCPGAVACDSTVDVASVTALDPERPRRRRPRGQSWQCTSGRRRGDDGSVHAGAQARGDRWPRVKHKRRREPRIGSPTLTWAIATGRKEPRHSSFTSLRFPRKLGRKPSEARRPLPEEVKLVELDDRRLRKRVIGEVGQRRTAPPSQSLPQRPCGLLGAPRGENGRGPRRPTRESARDQARPARGEGCTRALGPTPGLWIRGGILSASCCRSVANRR